MAQNSLEEHHNVKFDEITVLAQGTDFYKLARREALEQHPNRINRGEETINRRDRHDGETVDHDELTTGIKE